METAMEGPKEKLVEAVETVDEGRSEVTPFAALGGVTVVVFGAVGLLIALVLVLWLVLR